jgi:hypothetical protein
VLVVGEDVVGHVVGADPLAWQERDDQRRVGRTREQVPRLRAGAREAAKSRRRS